MLPIVMAILCGRVCSLPHSVGVDPEASVTFVLVLLLDENKRKIDPLTILATKIVSSISLYYLDSFGIGFQG